MSGHSKWANIKHRKGAADIKKGKVFSRIGKEIMVSVRQGGKDVATNARLRTALLAAKNGNMPKDNVERAIKKGAGEGANALVYETVFYEGWSNGVAVLAECLTDNKNRTASEIRMLFDRNNGTLAGGGSVSRLFQRKAHFVIKGENADENKLMDIVLDAGAEDIEVDDGIAEIWGPQDAFDTISKALESAKIACEESGIVQKPGNLMEITDISAARQVMGLVEVLEEQEDIQAVYSNFDVPSEVLEQLAAEQK
ncbi:MAG: YebC/PmpR family DNA-binding transcriptional regulator [Victivallales bacterium]